MSGYLATPTPDTVLGMMVAICVEEKGPATNAVSAVANPQSVHGAWRYNMPGVKRLSSSVDPRTPRH